MNQISINDLKKLTDQEGLILQGCGGEPQEWIDGINDLFTSEGILLEGSKFANVSIFEFGDLTNLLFHMDDSVDLDVGKLATWRIESHQIFGGTWLSDYLPNRLGVLPEDEKQVYRNEAPECPIIGADGNIFNILGIATRTLKDCGMKDEAQEMRSRVIESGSYDAALAVIMEYVTPVDAESHQSNSFDMEMQY